MKKLLGADLEDGWNLLREWGELEATQAILCFGALDYYLFTVPSPSLL